MEIDVILKGASLAIEPLKGYSDIEQMAILKSAAGTVESMINAKAMAMVMANALK